MSSSPRNSDPSENSIAPPKCSVDNTVPSSPHAPTEPDFPEGGIVAWCTVLGAFLVQFCGFGYKGSFGVYQAFYSEQYFPNKSASAISWIGSSVSPLVTVMGPISGRLFDKGYFYHIFITGAVLQSFSLFMLSLVQPGQYYQALLAQGLASGIGQGLMYAPSFAILSHHFKRRRAVAMSIVSSGAPLGNIVNTIMLNNLLNGPIGFNTGVRISAAFITVLLFLSCILVRTRYNSAVRQEAASVNFWKSAKKCFTEVLSLLTIIGFTLFQTGYLYPNFYFQVDALKHGLSHSFAFYAIVVADAGNFVSRISAGTVLPFVSVINLTIISTFLCAILIICMIWLSSVASFVVLGLLYGIFAGMNIAMMGPMFGLTSGLSEFGVRIGVGFAITGIGGLVGSPICGALLTRNYRWWAPALFCGLVILVAGILFVCARFLFIRGGASSVVRCASDESEETMGNESEKKAVEA